MGEKKEKGKLIKSHKKIVEGCIAGTAAGFAAYCASGGGSVLLLGSLVLSLIVCTAISVFDLHKKVTDKIFSNDKIDIAEEDNVGIAVKAAVKAVFCSAVIAVVIAIGVTSSTNAVSDAKIEQFETEIEAMQANIDDISSENEAIYRDFCSTSDLVDNNKKDVESYKNRIKELETQKQSFQDDIITYNAEIAEIEEKISIEEINGSSERILQYKNEISNHETQIIAVEEGISETEARIAELQKRLDIADMILKNNSAAMESQWTVYTDKLDKIQTLQDNIDAVKSTQYNLWINKPTFDKMLIKILIASFVVCFIAYAAIDFLKDIVIEKISEIKAQNAEKAEKNEQSQSGEDNGQKEA